MSLRSTFRPRLGPFVINTNRWLMPTSVSFVLGPIRFRIWGRDSMPGVSSVDLPGPWSYRPRIRRR